MINTNGVRQEFQVIPTTHYSVRFHVRACQEANIQLNTVKSYMSYDLVVGAEGNTKIILSKPFETLTTVTAVDILQCERYKQFWLTWSEQTIRLGEGDTIGDIFLLEYPYDPSDGAINQLHFFTETTGQWMVSREQGHTIRVITEPGQPYGGNWFPVLPNKHMTFSVASCLSISILMSDIIGVTTEQVYEVRPIE